jgi:aspartyl aminopeptidase
VCGQKPPHESGFLLIGAHTDSPNLRIKPAPDLARAGYRQLGVEPYGGVLLHTWLDRDLSLAGRVVIDSDGEHREMYLVDFGKALLRIPSLAIHLNRNVNSEGLVLNAQNHLAPVLALDHSGFPALHELLAAELGKHGQPCLPDRIVGWDLCLYDVQRASLLGLHDEFVLSARLDNLASCFAAVSALVDIDGPADETRGFVLYDHEEVGSRSAQGAHSPFLRTVLERAAAAQCHDADAFARAVARSFLISADMAHAVHPNYTDRHEPEHRPVLGAGPVLKTNVNQSYATDGESAARFAQVCRAASVEPQHYVVRSDLACGSTIGPISASQLGLRAVDIGNPLLSMHSIREMAAVADVDSLARVLGAFYS